MEVAIIGTGHTEFGELWRQGLFDLMARVQLEAFCDAKLDPNEIEEIFVANMCAQQLFGQGHLGAVAADIFGLQCPVVSVEAACASGGVAVRQAVHTILSGRASVVMVVGAEKLSDTSVEQVTTSFMSASMRNIEYIHGATFPGLFAMVAQHYLEKYKITREQLAQVSIKNHFHGKNNTLAHFQKEISMHDFSRSPMIADPLTLLDCSPLSDGAACLVLSSVEYAKKTGKDYVSIIACESATDRINIADRASIITLQAIHNAADKAFAVAKMQRSDIDFVEVHDAFSPAELMSLESLGFFKPGQAALATQEGYTMFSGNLPVNVSGGLKSKGHPVGATGVSQIVELTKQIRGQAGLRQLKKANVGLAHNMGGIGTSVVVTIVAQRN